MKTYYTYILTNYTNNVFYIGVTSNLSRRLTTHKMKISSKSFSNKYNLYKLVYFERYNSIYSAIQREKNLKGWKRQWKIDLIITVNKEMKDLLNDSELNS